MLLLVLLAIKRLEDVVVNNLNIDRHRVSGLVLSGTLIFLGDLWSLDGECYLS
mgnify:FL=1